MKTSSASVLGFAGGGGGGPGCGDGDGDGVWFGHTHSTFGPLGGLQVCDHAYFRCGE